MIRGLKPVVVVAGTRPEIFKMAPVIRALNTPIIRKRVLVIRLCTERQEAVEAGFVKLVGTERNRVFLAAMHEALEENEELPPVSPFGDGTAATKTVEVTKKDFT